MAFGFTLAFSRLGSVLNFLLTAHFDEMFGLQWTLWAGKCSIFRRHTFVRCSVSAAVMAKSQIKSQCQITNL